MTPQFRFTFFNDALYPAGIVVNQPLGWRDAKLSLTRDPIFHSLIEYFKGSFIWYGTARVAIIAVETVQGPGAKLRVLIEQQYSAGWVSIFDGLLDIPQLEDIAGNGTFYKISVPIIRDDFWSRLINRRGIKINIGGAKDMDGNAVTPTAPLTFNLTCQKIFKQYNGQSATGINAPWSNTDFIQVNTDVDLYSEISLKYNFPTAINPGKPVNLFQIDEAGDYNLSLEIRTNVNTLPTDTLLTFYFQKNNDAPIAFTKVNTPIFTPTSTINTFAATMSLVKGDLLYVFGDILVSSTPGDVMVISAHYVITGNTVVPDTTCEVFRIYESFLSVLEKITGQAGCLDGGTELLGCSGTYHLMPGTSVRGYSLANKPLFASFDDLWQGADPLFNLGMGYFDAGSGVQKLEILKKEDFYDKTPVINFSNVPNLVRTYALEKIFRKISIGFKTWSAESGSGIDDPQTKHDYDTSFATIGKDISLLSTFYGASLGIEQARRQQKEINKDYKLDNEIMIIAYKHSDQGYPELDENFSSITNLLISPTRYNSRLTPAENLLRWLDYFNGCMQTGGSGKYFFRAGEGNIKMTSQLNGGDCDPHISKAENADISSTADFMFLPNQYKCSIPMDKASYDTILANRKKAIGINSIPMFIMDMDYSIMFGHADFTLLQAL